MDLSTIDFKALGEALQQCIGPGADKVSYSMTDVMAEHGLRPKDWEEIQAILVELGYHRCGWVKYTRFAVYQDDGNGLRQDYTMYGEDPVLKLPSNE